jgi:energy-coupling factor transport system permease protein
VSNRGLVPVYQAGTSTLHSARAAVTSTYCGALALVAILFEHPVVLGALLVAVVASAAAAGVGRELARAAPFAVTIAVMITVVNPLVANQGTTLLVHGDEVFGHRVGDVTLEALAFGAAFGLRAGVLILTFALYSAVVDPDQMLHLFRRFGHRSALTATLATRLVPLLARDASRMSDAARCRPRPPGRAERARATLAGALDRAVDVAAALEVRGYGDARRPRHARAPWSRHDARVAVTAALVAGVAIGLAVAGGTGFKAYPRLQLDVGPAWLAGSALIVALALAPFAGAGARLGVARA